MRFTEDEEKAILIGSGLLFDPLSADIVRAIKDKYSEPTRFYHDWTHALSVLSWVNHVCSVIPAQAIAPYTHYDLRLAALFHDVIYTTQGSPQNEIDSVAFMQMLAISDSDRAAEIIMATAQHGKLEASDVPLAIALFMDCDIATFGEMRWEVARWNDRNVVQELLQKYTEAQVAEGRKKFLGSMLAKKSIFLSDYFRVRFEAQARSNIQRLIAEVP